MNREGKWTQSSLYRSFISTLMVSVLLAALVMGCTSSDTLVEESDSLKRSTQYGTVAGFEDTEASWAWLGIPFAAPPVGDLRWKAPQAPDAWEGVRAATDPAPQCFQGSGEEDCLYLDIYRPNSEAMDLPVYAWIHGGSNSSGSAPNLTFFARDANVVVVSIRYRLGPLGFFKHDALSTGDTFDDSGNFGLLDQMMALAWVKNNIQAFGGDPENVTAAGESAGAHDVLAMMVSPYGVGLFHKAIYQSGGMSVIPLSRAKEISAGYVQNLGLTATGEALATELRALAPRDIVGAEPSGASFGVTADGNVIPDNYHCLLAAGDYNKVPILMGGNRNEGSLWLVLYEGVSGLWAGLITFLYGNPQLTVDEILTPEQQDDYTFASTMNGSLWQARRVHAVARSMREHQDNVYVYDFQWGGTEGTDVAFVFGAAHANEIAYFHNEGDSDVWGGNLSISEDNAAARAALSKVMRTYYAQFLHSGNPNGEADIPQWQPWSNAAEGVKALNLDASSESGSAELNIFMTTKEYDLEELHTEIDGVTSPDLISYYEGSEYTPLCPAD